MDRQAHLRLVRESLKAYSQLVDYWVRQVEQKGAIGDWPSVDLDRFSRDVTEPLKFLKDETGRSESALKKDLDRPVEGEAVGLDGDGRLLVRDAEGERAFGAGDVVHLR